MGRAEFCRKAGFSYEEMERTTGSFLIVVEAYCRYLRPLRYDTAFLVRTRLEQLRSKTLRFSYELLTDSGELCARGYTKHAVTGKDGRLKRFPEEYRAYLSAGPGGNEKGP